ncbi:MAG: glucosaminidase domain-containing protein [Lewinellaceae bacterium]|nr:glucosaminidase domain-containing protein [Lewinellaceae bacterium]
MISAICGWGYSVSGSRSGFSRTGSPSACSKDGRSSNSVFRAGGLFFVVRRQRSQRTGSGGCSGDPEGNFLEWKESGQIIPLPTIAGKIKNEAAPVSKNEIIPFDAGKYIDRFKQIAIDEMEKYGVPASISLAQGLIESRAGSSKLAVNNNNHFGIKCFSRKCKKGHCSNFTDDTHKDFFRIFKTPWESWREHSKLLTNKRFSRLKKYGRDYKKWAHGLESLGYATDRSYAEKLIGIIERYNLNKYDR